MNIMTFEPKPLMDGNAVKNILSQIGQPKETSRDIQLGMSPAEIADIVSDRLMVMISAQFESTKIQFATSNNSHAD